MLSSNLADFDFGQSFQLSLEAAFGGIWWKVTKSNYWLTVFRTHPPTGLSADTHHQLHCAGLPAPLLRHRFRGRLADATGHGVAGDWPHTARRGHPLLVRQRHRHVGGLPVHREVPGRGAHRGVRRRGRHCEPDERRAVQAVDREAETACDANGAPRERTCEHAAELHDCGLHQECALLTMMQEDSFNQTHTHTDLFGSHSQLHEGRTETDSARLSLRTLTAKSSPAHATLLKK